MLLLSMTVGVMAESAAPTEVKNCTYSGFDSTLNISFEDSAKAWLDAITDVTANGVTYTKGTIPAGAQRATSGTSARCPAHTETSRH